MNQFEDYMRNTVYRPYTVASLQRPTQEDFHLKTCKTPSGKWVNTGLAKTNDFAGLSDGFKRVFELKVLRYNLS